MNLIKKIINKLDNLDDTTDAFLGTVFVVVGLIVFWLLTPQ